MKVSAKLAEALTGLRGNAYFEEIMRGMAEHEAEEATRCRVGDGPVLYRAQGAATALQFWRDSFRDAPTTLEKYRNQPQGK